MTFSFLLQSCEIVKVIEEVYKTVHYSINSLMATHLYVNPFSPTPCLQDMAIVRSLSHGAAMGLISPREYIDLVAIRRNTDGGLYISYCEISSWLCLYSAMHVLMRDDKEGASKVEQTQGKATQQIQGSHFS